MEINFKKKYLKYKTKYLKFKNIDSQKNNKISYFKRGNVKVSVATINQTALDFNGNELRIKQAIILAKLANSKLLLLPELAVSGYSCKDHFFEAETYEKSFNVITNLLRDPELTNNIIIAIGCPIIYKNIKYNTTIFILNRKIILIRPKMYFASNRTFYESRWFTLWPSNKFEEYIYYDGDGSRQTTSIGIAILNCNDILIASEICEELGIPNSINNHLYLNGVDIILNSSASNFETNKLDIRIKIIKDTTYRSGGLYLYSNLE